jgi:hypothetical protein
MTCDRSVSECKLFLAPGQAELQRQLLEQFYEDSMGRHGVDSEQVRGLSRLLIPIDSAGGPCKALAAHNST